MFISDDEGLLHKDVPDVDGWNLCVRGQGPLSVQIRGLRYCKGGDYYQYSGPQIPNIARFSFTSDFMNDIVNCL